MKLSSNIANRNGAKLNWILILDEKSIIYSNNKGYCFYVQIYLITGNDSHEGFITPSSR
jgi:hypothetical protein